MAHWIYLCPSTSAKIGTYNSNDWRTAENDEKDTIIPNKYVSLSGDVTGFPLYTEEAGVIFTQQQPANGLMLRCANGTNSGSIFYRYWASIIACYGSDYYRVIDANKYEALYDQSYSVYNYQILPNKLFRVDDTSFDGYSTVYTDETISGTFRMNGTGSNLPQGCLVPVGVMVNGELYEGIGNYAATFTYEVSPDRGYGGNGAVTSTRSFLTSKTSMAPKYLKRNGKSNKLVLTDIKEGDILDFGSSPQSVPSIFKNWVLTNCTETTDAPEPMRVDIITPNGTQLFTAGKLCNWDVKAIPKLQTKTATPSTISQEVVADSGNAGLAKVIVNPIPKELGMPDEYDGSLVTEITFTIDGTEYEAEDGMNWKDWAADASCNKNGSVIIGANGTLYKDGSDEIRTSQNDVVFAEDLIIGGENYVFGSIAPEITFTIQGAEFKAEEGMTWGKWVDNRFYNNGRFIPLDDNVHDQSCWMNVHTYDDIPVTLTDTIVDGAAYKSGEVWGSN